MLEVLRSHFIRTAIAKGLPLHIVILRHALRPALVPVAGYLAPAVASIMTGSLVVETIAGLPGIGRYLVQGALNRDYTLVMGMVILYSTVLIGMGLVVDLLYAWLDPRIDGSSGQRALCGVSACGVCGPAQAPSSRLASSACWWRWRWSDLVQSE